MKIILFSILFFVISFSASNGIDRVSLKSNLDSLKQDLSKSQKANLYVNISWDYHFYNLDSAMKYSYLATNVIDTTANKKLYAKALDIRGIIFFEKKLYDSSRYYNSKSTIIRKEINDYIGLRSCYEEKGNLEMVRANFDNAIKFYLKALDAIDKYIDSKNIEFNVKDFKTYTIHEMIVGISDNEEDLNPELLEIRHLIAYKANIYFLISKVYYLKDDIKQSLEYLRKAVRFNKKSEDFDQYLLAKIFEIQIKKEINKNYEVKELEKLKKLAFLGNNKSMLSEIYLIEAKDFFYSGEFKKAMIYKDSSDFFGSSLEGDSPIRVKLFDFEYSLKANQEYEVAENLMLNLKSQYEKMSFNQKVKYLNLSIEFYKNLDKKDSVITHLEKLYELKNEKLNSEVRSHLDNLLVEFDTKEKENKILNQQEEIVEYQNVNFLLFTVLILISILMLFIIWSYRKTKKLNREIEQLNKSLASTLVKKDKLHSYVAHDIRGPLKVAINTLKRINTNNLTLTKVNSYTKELEAYLMNTHQYAENILYQAGSSDEDINTDIKEVDIERLINEVVDTHKTEMEIKNILVEKEIFINEVNTDKTLLTAILNNLISNAIKNSNDNGLIVISTKEINNNWQLEVSNTGNRIDDEVIKKFNQDQEIESKTGFGIGLKIIRDFSNILKAEKIEISNTEKTKIRIIFPT